MSRTLIYGLINGIGLTLLLYLRTSFDIEFISSNSSILNLLTTSLCIYLAIAAFINSKNNRSYNYLTGFTIGVAVSAIGVLLALSVLYVRITILLGHEMTSSGQAVAYFFGNVMISALIPLLFLRNKREISKSSTSPVGGIEEE